MVRKAMPSAHLGRRTQHPGERHRPVSNSRVKRVSMVNHARIENVVSAAIE